jgi:putative membrane protein
VTSLAALTDTQASAERVLTTPLPIGYNILISQIVLLYVYLLPFQLWPSLHWVTIPGTIAAAYIIVGLAAIGNELENPFGNDVNDLPLDSYCMELAKELDTLTSVPAPKFSQVLKGGKEGGMGGVLSDENRVLWPLSSSGYGEWVNRSESDIRSALKAKVVVGKGRAYVSGSETPSDGSLRMSA